MLFKDLSDMTVAQLHREVEDGAKLVVYSYTISILIMTFKRGSSIYFFRPGEGRILDGLLYTLITLLFGWWGFPWGPIYSIMSLVTNFSGGEDVTQKVLASLSNKAASPTRAKSMEE